MRFLSPLSLYYLTISLMDFIPNLKYKTSFCQSTLLSYLSHILDQHCFKAHNCHFAHCQQELRTLEQNQLAMAQQNQMMQAYHSTMNLSSNYKTVKCKFFAKGKCQLGANCTFYHSKSQRRSSKANKDSSINTLPQNCQYSPIYNPTHLQYSWNCTENCYVYPYSQLPQSNKSEQSTLNSPIYKQEKIPNIQKKQQLDSLVITIQKTPDCKRQTPNKVDSPDKNL